MLKRENLIFFETSFDNVITFYWQFEYRVSPNSEGFWVMIMMMTLLLVTIIQGSEVMTALPGNIHPRPGDQGLAPMSSARLRLWLRSSDCNGVTTAVASQPPLRQHHTVITSYPSYNHRLVKTKWPEQEMPSGLKCERKFFCDTTHEGCFSYSSWTVPNGLGLKQLD